MVNHGTDNVTPVEYAIDATSPIYGYRQLADQLRAQIKDGTIATQLPSLNQLVADSGLSMSSVQHALSVLKAEGLIYGVGGRGTFVRRPQ